MATNHHRAHLALALSAALLVALPATAEAKTVKLTGKANGKTVTLHKGDTLKLALRGESGSSGYFWQVTKRSSQSILRSHGSHFKDDPHPPMNVGYGGTRTYTWKATGTGTTSTRLKLGRAGRDGEVGERFRLTVRVN